MIENTVETTSEDQKKINELEAILILENGSLNFSKALKLLRVNQTKLIQLIQQLNANYQKIGSITWIRQRENRLETFVHQNYQSDLLGHYEQKKDKPKPAALETLSVIAYEQPITLPEIDAIRGVSSVAQLKFLLNEELVLPAGKKETVGNPTLFKTSPHFLDRFNLKSLKELPALEEIKTYSFLKDE